MIETFIFLRGWKCIEFMVKILHIGLKPAALEDKRDVKGGENMTKTSILLENQKVKNFTFSNRYACAPFDIATATEDGLITDELLSIIKSARGFLL